MALPIICRRLLSISLIAQIQLVQNGPTNPHPEYTPLKFLYFYRFPLINLGEAYSFVELRIKLVKILHSAFRWTLSKVSSISNITVYIVEDPPSTKADVGYIIRKVLTMHQGDLNPVEDVNAPRIFRNDDVFKEYLFKCADHSEPTTTETFGHLHWTIPVRDIDGFPMGVIDIEIGENELSKPDEENILWMVSQVVKLIHANLSYGESGTQR